MQFKVPQFLDIEDKIFGPFTFSEFAYLAGGGGLCFIIYKMLGLLFGIIPMFLIAGLALALTFYKPNGKPFIHMIESWMKYLTQNKLYIWQRSKPTKKTPEENKIKKPETFNENHILGSSKLRDLAWSLDVLDLKKENTNN